MAYECPHCGYIAETTGFPSCPGCGCSVREAYRPLSDRSTYKGLFLGARGEAAQEPGTADPRGIVLHAVRTVDSELSRLVESWYLAAESQERRLLDRTVSAFSSALAGAGLHPFSPRGSIIIMRKVWAVVAGALMMRHLDPLCENCTFSMGQGACEIGDVQAGAPGCPLFADLVDTENLKLRLRSGLGRR